MTVACRALVLENSVSGGVPSEAHPTLKTLSMGPPGPGEALVRVKAAALNHRDAWIRKGKYAD
ncbi:MAG TPA: alcohol dehydrogenase, partial [Fibrobacteria bacterium]|nr:alcohol dehydrogenase [Fibrobacteria bacterium]